MPGQGLDRIPLRIPDDWDPRWFETFVRDVLSLADVRNATEGPGIAISGASDEEATVSASADLSALLDASLVLAIADPDLPNARQLVAGDGSITITDTGDELELELTRFGVTLDRLMKIPALSILGSQNLEDPGNVDVVQSAADDTIPRRVAGAIEWGQITLPMIPDALITFAKLQNADALSVLGRASNSSGVIDEISAGTTGNVLRRSGTSIGFGSIDLDVIGAVGTSRLSFNNLATGTARSVLGVTGNSSGVSMASIQGTTDQVLRVNGAGTALAFGSIDLSQSAAVGSSRLAFANVAQITGQAVLGVASAGAGNLAAIAAGTNDRLLSQTSGSLAFTQLTAGMFPNAVVPDAALSSNVPLLNGVNNFTGANSIVLANTVDVRAKTSGGVTWQLLSIQADDKSYIGNGGLPTVVNGTDITVNAQNDLLLQAIGVIKISALTVSASPTTGAQTATFSATNKPGSGTAGPSLWWPVTYAGTTYYIPMFGP